MKLPVYSVKGETREEMNAGKAFSHKVRRDIIKRAVLAEQSRKRQPYGTDPKAGQRTSAHYHGRRGIKQSMMNREMARMPRIHGSGFLHMRARFVPQATKGREAHPPKVERVWTLKINKKERSKALLSAISACADMNMVSARGHILGNVKHVPIVIEDKLSEMNKTRDVLELLSKLGLGEELGRAAAKKIRAGRGKTRGRKSVLRKGPIIIIKEDRGIMKAADNIPGIDILTVKDLAVEDVAPGAVPGRLSIWTKTAVEEIEKL